MNWRERFIADVTHILEIEGYKAVQTITKPCIKAVFARKEDMELNPSTMHVAPTTSQTLLHTMQQSFTLTPSPSLSELGRTTSSQILSTSTEPLHTVASLHTTYSGAFVESSATIQSSLTMYVQPSSTTTTEDIFLPHECGDVIRPAGYNHLETTVLLLQNWPQGFTGQITFTTTVDVRDGWQVELVMNKEISSIIVYTVSTAATSGKRFTFHNKDYNKQLEKGTSVAIDFEATKQIVNENVPCMRAVFMWPIEKPCAKITSVTGSNFINATVTITSQWNEGIAGKITIVVPEEIRNGWKIDVLFDIPLTLTVYDAISSSSTGTLFTLTNQSYNRELQNGHTLGIDFNAAKQETGATVLCAHAIFHW